MPTTLTFTVPLDLTITVPSTSDDDRAFDADVSAAHEQVRGVLQQLRSDNPDVRVFVETVDLPDPVEHVHPEGQDR
ncbi:MULTISPECIES: hypothetical protein [unclassified Cellulomonas]|uniref:hypothetical protein n=1 Tax=unclassified Cellulomonas TaxID=2620175 RepID=UPI001C500D23|nr:MULTISPECIES: hypothetical protein [unclassified Cellulomonas]MBW0254484.1 hypothetical protein [Cellulomonas sp. PS-H5]MCG7284711.1 hypothetical protein [Cellulomonas sp. ACRRI]